MTRSAIALAVLAALVAAAPTSHAGSPGSGGIVGGAPTATDPAVALILPLDDQQNILGVCSGTLIAPDVVVTAAHCVDDRIGASGFGVYFGSDFTAAPDPAFVFVTVADSVAFHPQWNPDDLENGFDIGVVHLAEPAPIAPMPFNTAPLAETEIGQPVRLVGWGITAGGGSDSGIKRQVVSRLDDFDPKLVLIGNADTNTCNGDSGGPAFMVRDGREVLIGITSFGDINCEQIGVSTRVDVFLDFLAGEGVDTPAPLPDDGGDPADPTDPTDPIDPDGPTGGFPTPRRDEGGCSAAGGAGNWIALLAVFALAWCAPLRRRRAPAVTRPFNSTTKRKRPMTNRLMFALVFAMTLTMSLGLAACGGGDDPVVDGCERLDECNALVDGISTNECVENVDLDLENLTPSQRDDWEGLMTGCLDFSSCELFLDCVTASGL